MNIKNNNYKFVYLSVAFVSIILIILMMFLTKYCCFFGDDFYYSIYIKNEKYFDCLFGASRFGHGGYYIGLFLTKFLSFGLPNLLHIHPSEFINRGHSLFRSVFTAITLLYMSKFICFSKNLKYLFLSAFCFITAYFFFYGLGSGVFIINYNWYR